MAMQHLVAFSSTVEGAAIVAGAPYGCGRHGAHGHWVSGGRCYNGGTNVTAAAQYIREQFKAGLIDDPRNLRSTPILVFNGKEDFTVKVAVSQDIVKQLTGLHCTKVKQNFQTSAAHVWSLDHGQCGCGECAQVGAGLCCNVNNCRYDLSGNMFNHFYGAVKPRTQANGKYTWVQQQQYAEPSKHSGAHVSKWGVLYVPTGCRQKPETCRVHIHYHGCIANDWKQRLMWINNLDLNEYAEANKIILVYPQDAGDAHTGNGCWNWGFMGDDPKFDTKKSLQLRMVINMVADMKNILKNGQELPYNKSPPLESEALGDDLYIV